VRIARIDKATGAVLNIEAVEQDWLDANADDPDHDFVVLAEDDAPVFGLGYDPVTGFEQPEPVQEVTVTAAQLEALGLTSEQIEALGLSTEGP
jgi:hypothetical protein